VDLETLGRLLRQRREDLGISRAGLARRLGVSANYLWMIEAAIDRAGGAPSRPGEDLLGRWSDALAISALYRHYFMRLAGYAEGGTEEPILEETGAPGSAGTPTSVNDERSGDMADQVVEYDPPTPRYDAAYALAYTRDRLLEGKKITRKAYLASLEYGHLRDLKCPWNGDDDFAQGWLVWLATFVDPTVPPGKESDDPFPKVQGLMNARTGEWMGTACHWSR
jgi:transcriptional regulator with XRE-family HTH domain